MPSNCITNKKSYNKKLRPINLHRLPISNLAKKMNTVKDNDKTPVNVYFLHLTKQKDQSKV